MVKSTKKAKTKKKPRPQRQHRRVDRVILQSFHRPDGELTYRATIPAWIVKKVLQAKPRDTLLWDFQGGTATLTKIE